MLSEFEQIERSAGAEKAADLRKALHFLLRRQFVFAGDARTATVYSTIMDSRFRSAIDGFVRARIAKTIGAENFVNHRDKAVDFVREYMRHLVPHASFVGKQNANSLQKAVVNAMTLDHDQTATEFVRKYILEDSKMRIGELRASIQAYRNINETIKKMRERLDALKMLRSILAELDEGLRGAVFESKLAHDTLSSHAARESSSGQTNAPTTVLYTATARASPPF